MTTLPQITAAFDSKLKPLGFERKGKTWNRTVHDFTDVIEIQKSQYDTTVTMNVGVLARTTYPYIWRVAVPSFVDAASCTVETRSGFLMGKLDHWWRLEDENTREAMLSCLSGVILPFWETQHSLEAMLSFMRTQGLPGGLFPIPSISYAVVQFQAGDTQGAHQTLKEINEKVLRRKFTKSTMASEVATRLGLDLTQPFHSPEK